MFSSGSVIGRESAYEILGISHNATSDDLKKAYRKKILLAHPDKGGNSEEFQKIQLSYDAIKDVIGRKRPPPDAPSAQPSCKRAQHVEPQKDIHVRRKPASMVEEISGVFSRFQSQAKAAAQAKAKAQAHALAQAQAQAQAHALAQAAAAKAQAAAVLAKTRPQPPPPPMPPRSPEKDKLTDTQLNDLRMKMLRVDRAGRKQLLQHMPKHQVKQLELFMQMFIQKEEIPPTRPHRSPDGNNDFVGNKAAHEQAKESSLFDPIADPLASVSTRPTRGVYADASSKPSPVSLISVSDSEEEDSFNSSTSSSSSAERSPELPPRRSPPPQQQQQPTPQPSSSASSTHPTQQQGAAIPPLGPPHQQPQPRSPGHLLSPPHSPDPVGSPSPPRSPEQATQRSARSPKPAHQPARSPPPAPVAPPPAVPSSMPHSISTPTHAQVKIPSPVSYTAAYASSRGYPATRGGVGTTNSSGAPPPQPHGGNHQYPATAPKSPSPSPQRAHSPRGSSVQPPHSCPPRMHQVNNHLSSAAASNAATGHHHGAPPQQPSTIPGAQNKAAPPEHPPRSPSPPSDTVYGNASAHQGPSYLRPPSASSRPTSSPPPSSYPKMGESIGGHVPPRGTPVVPGGMASQSAQAASALMPRYGNIQGPVSNSLSPIDFSGHSTRSSVTSSRQAGTHEAPTNAPSQPSAQGQRREQNAHTGAPLPPSGAPYGLAGVGGLNPPFGASNVNPAHAGGGQYATRGAPPTGRPPPPPPGSKVGYSNRGPLPAPNGARPPPPPPSRAEQFLPSSRGTPSASPPTRQEQAHQAQAKPAPAPQVATKQQAVVVPPQQQGPHIHAQQQQQRVVQQGQPLQRSGSQQRVVEQQQQAQVQQARPDKPQPDPVGQSSAHATPASPAAPRGAPAVPQTDPKPSSRTAAAPSRCDDESTSTQSARKRSKSPGASVPHHAASTKYQDSSDDPSTTIQSNHAAPVPPASPDGASSLLSGDVPADPTPEYLTELQRELTSLAKEERVKTIKLLPPHVRTALHCWVTTQKNMLGPRKKSSSASSHNAAKAASSDLGPPAVTIESAPIIISTCSTCSEEKAVVEGQCIQCRRIVDHGQNLRRTLMALEMPARKEAYGKLDADERKSMRIFLEKAQKNRNNNTSNRVAAVC